MMTFDQRTCKVCGRSWRPYTPDYAPFYRSRGNFNIYPDWFKTDWVYATCNDCMERFVRWGDRYKSEIIFQEGEYCFMIWLVQMFKRDIKEFMKNGNIKLWCQALNENGQDCCRRSSRDGFCLTHWKQHRQLSLE